MKHSRFLLVIAVALLFSMPGSAQGKRKVIIDQDCRRGSSGTVALMGSSPEEETPFLL